GCGACGRRVLSPPRAVRLRGGRGDAQPPDRRTCRGPVRARRRQAGADRVMSRTAMIVARVGHRAGKRSGPSGSVRRLGLVLASAMIVISVAMLLMLGAVSAQRQSRLEAREPVPASTDGAHTVAFWLDSLDFSDVRQFLLVYVVPVDEIGRASCRERGELAVVGAPVKQ